MNMASLYRRALPAHPTKPYRVMVTWHQPGCRAGQGVFEGAAKAPSSRITCEAESDNPRDLKGAPMIARNPRSIARIEIHGPAQRGGSQASAPTCVLETVWASHWVGYQKADREPAYHPPVKPAPTAFVTALQGVSTRD